MKDTPEAEYGARLAERGARAAWLRRVETRLSNARLVVFLLALAVAAVVFVAHRLGGVWLVPPLGAFAVLVIWHDRVIRARLQADRAVAFYERGLARIAGTWMGGGVRGEAFLDPSHPYAADLDIFGEGSLFELLCTARTAAGEACLARWLGQPSPYEVLRERHAALTELRPRLDLREDLALLGEDVRAGLHAQVLAEWGAHASPHGVGTWRAIAAGLAVLALLAAAAWPLGVGPLPLVFVGALEAIVTLRFRGQVGQVLAAVEQPARDLALLAELLERLESEPFTSPRLATLRAAMETEGAPPSREIARLRRLLELADARRNQLFWPIAALTLWGLQFALAIEAWRRRCGGHLADWLESVGEIEALCALAGYAFEHPGDPFPELCKEGPVFDGEGLGHPLLPESRCVRNEVRLDRGESLWVVSGSNMSGKSTLLRTVGTNTVLALAGAPVRARRLRVSDLRVGASIRAHDSLLEGESRFYAEIKRLRQIADLARDERHSLFLLDEILHGTNSHDRQIGAAALVRGLVERGAIGLVTTHDLALSKIAEDLAPHARNVHFEDHLQDGRIAFDYRLHPGVVEKSNALALMREVGLDV